MTVPRQRFQAGAPLLLLLGLTIGWRVLFLFTGAGLLDSDEAVEGIMAQRLLQGKFLIYFIDQHYLGRLENYLLALFFAVTRLETPLGIKFFGLLIGCAFTASLYLLIQTLYRERRAAFCAALFAACSPALFTLWTLKVRGFVFTLILGQLILWLAVRISDRAACGRSNAKTWPALGLLSGLALYHYILVAPYLVIAALLLLCGSARKAILHELRRAAQWALLLPLLLLLLAPLVYQGLGVYGLPLPQPVYRALAVLLLFVALAVLAVRVFASARHPAAKRLPFVDFTLAFAAGFAPAIYHSATAPDLWYKNAPVSFADLRVLLISSLFQNLPYLLGPMTSPSDLSMSHFRHPAYSAPWFDFLYAILTFSALSCFVYLTLRRGVPGMTGRTRKANLLLLALLLCAWVLFCLSGPASTNTRHLLPMYSGVFGILGFQAAFLFSHRRSVGIVTTLLFIGVFAHFNFRHRLAEVVWPEYLRPVTAQLKQLMREHDLRAAYCEDAGLCHELQFTLGTDYALVPTFRMLRFKDHVPRLERSTRFAVITPYKQPLFPAGQRLSFQQTLVGGQVLMYDFRRDGEPLSYAEYIRLRSASEAK